MTCKCRGRTAFDWKACSCPSVFAIDPSFTAGAKSGKTMGQIASNSATQFEERTGRSLGSVPGISAKAGLLTEQRQYQRGRAKAASKYAQASFERVQARKAKA